MVGLQVDGPLGVVWGTCKGLCGRSWAVLGPLLAVLGRLGSALGCYVDGLGPLFGPMFAVLGLMLAVLAALGAPVGAPEPSWAEKDEEHEFHDYLENVLIS